MKREITLEEEQYQRLIRLLSIASNVLKFRAGNYVLARETLCMATDIVLNSKEIK